MDKEEAILSKFIYNNEFYGISQFDKMFIDKNPSVYEVIRILDKIPLFLEEHYHRLVNSANLLGYELDLPFINLKNNILNMIIMNKIENCNVKIIINDLENTPQNIYYFFIKSEYPNEALYSNGINTLTYKATRENPNAKVIYKNMRDEINTILKNSNCFEAILVNSNDEVTEGSRSNLFFIKDKNVFTAPPEDVLLGITRQRIISLCRQNNITVFEKPIAIDSIANYDACFISGTSPKVLPIGTINDIHYEKSNELLTKIMFIYDTEIKNYILKNI